MAVPGSNLLTSALSLICRQSFSYYPFNARTVNVNGYYERTYGAPVPTTGSVQAVDRSLYADNGLDFTKRYIQVWTETDAEDLYRDRAGDQIDYDSRRWEITNADAWHTLDGWNSFLAVEVPTP